ncbi:hypothetical protein, partial [Escherichia coli]|uniref:hypothetical protein n=1 Tax=Escherichia coli TaxID=562 RepID=UPI00200097A1
RAYCLKTQPATGETYPKSDLFNKAECGTKLFPHSPVSIEIPIVNVLFMSYKYAGLDNHHQQNHE